jgi:hypothetical protein
MSSGMRERHCGVKCLWLLLVHACALFGLIRFWFETQAVQAHVKESLIPKTAVAPRIATNGTQSVQAHVKESLIPKTAVASRIATNGDPDVFSSGPVGGCELDAVKQCFRQHPHRRAGKSYWTAQKLVREHLPKLAAAFRRAGIPPIISHGTVLGFQRECALIPGDTDVDMCVLRDFLPTRKHYERFLKVLRESGYRCATSHFGFGDPGLQIFCVIADVRTDVMYFDIIIADEDFATGGCQQPPCNWTAYLSKGGVLRRGVVGPFGFRLIT